MLFLFSYPEEASITRKLGLPADDSAVMTSRGIWLPALPIYLYLTAYACVELYAFLFQALLIAEASVVGRICRRY